MRAVILAAAIVLATGAAVGGGKELLENGGFEDGMAGWRALDMSKEATFGLDKEVKHGGKYSLRCEKKGGARPDFLKASVELPAGAEKVAFSIAWRAGADAQGRIDAYFFDAAGETVGKGYGTVVSAKTTKGFEVAKAEYEVPKRATGFGINVVLAGKCVLWVDDVSVTASGSAKKMVRKKGANLLENGTFDAGVEGWDVLANGSGTGKVERDAKVKAAGKGALKVTRESARLFPEDGASASVEELGDARKYRLTFAARVEEGVEAAVVVQAFVEGVVTATRRVSVDAKEFQTGSVEVEMKEGCDRITVSLVVRGEGSAWFDEIVLVEK